MTRRSSMAAVLIAVCAATITTGLLGVSPSAQEPQEPPYPGSNLNRQQIVDKLVSDTPGTKVSVARGKEVYDAICAACHIFEDIGRSVGPDLTTLASRFGKRDVLDAILWPSRTISDQYTVTVFELNDGTFVSGVIVRETGNAVAITNADNLERPVVVALANVKERTESTVSLMPEHLVATYSLDDIDSLVSFVRGGR